MCCSDGTGTKAKHGGREGKDPPDKAHRVTGRNMPRPLMRGIGCHTPYIALRACTLLSVGLPHTLHSPEGVYTAVSMVATPST